MRSNITVIVRGALTEMAVKTKHAQDVPTAMKVVSDCWCL